METYLRRRSSCVAATHTKVDPGSTVSSCTATQQRRYDCQCRGSTTNDAHFCAPIFCSCLDNLRQSSPIQRHYCRSLTSYDSLTQFGDHRVLVWQPMTDKMSLYLQYSIFPLYHTLIQVFFSNFPQYHVLSLPCIRPGIMVVLNTTLPLQGCCWKHIFLWNLTTWHEPLRGKFRDVTAAPQSWWTLYKMNDNLSKQF